MKTILDQLHHIREMIQIISWHIKDLRNEISSHIKVIVRYEKLSQQNLENQDKYQWVKSVNNEQVMQARSLIRRCLNVNRDLCCSAAKINGSPKKISCSFHIHLKEQSNNLSLIPPHLIPEFFQKMDKTPCTFNKDQTCGFQKRNLALVTGSSCFDALGLNTLAAQKNHYNHYVLKTPKEITPETQANFNHRNKNEINAVASIVGVIMPAIFPLWHIFVGVGLYFLGTQDRQHMLEVSADGLYNM